MSGASVELRRGRLNRAGGGSETGAKRGLWSTSKRGYTLVERNHRTRHGEIEIVMCDEKSLSLIRLIPKYKAQRPLITIPCSPQ